MDSLAQKRSSFSAMRRRKRQFLFRPAATHSGLYLLASQQ
uniref:Uncharacterized protein n=1 Tax=Peronospora matthiolae TaxID=2874970 RepID=A0AAV1V1L2_9STRA